MNMTPFDAKHVFAWAGPNLPNGWHGVRASKENPGTRVIVHEDPKPGSTPAGPGAPTSTPSTRKEPPEKSPEKPEKAPDKATRPATPAPKRDEKPENDDIGD